MFKDATVTLKYSELQRLVEDNKELSAKVEHYEKQMFSYDTSKVVKGLDSIFDILDKASKLTDPDKKQFHIRKAMECYCDCVGIEEDEVLKDVPLGKE